MKRRFSDLAGLCLLIAACWCVAASAQRGRAVPGAQLPAPGQSAKVEAVTRVRPSGGERSLLARPEPAVVLLRALPLIVGGYPKRRQRRDAQLGSRGSDRLPVLLPIPASDSQLVRIDSSGPSPELPLATGPRGPPTRA